MTGCGEVKPMSAEGWWWVANGMKYNKVRTYSGEWPIICGRHAAFPSENPTDSTPQLICPKCLVRLGLEW